MELEEEEINAMAIFHLDVKNVSRSQGRSAVGAAAYRAGERIVDERLGLPFDYSKKKGVGYSEILTPPGAPEWAKDRTQLWNTVEVIEKRKDARLAKEIMIALPKELTQDERIDLVKSYCNEQFVAKGMVADINIHEDNPENPHVHILLTTRDITKEGFGLKNRDWNKCEWVFELRREWQEIANQHLHIAGHETRIDCRSLQERGIDLEPGLHLGQAPHHAASRGEGGDFNRYRDHMDIMRANGERIIRDPSIVLEKLTQQQSVFDDYTIAKIANQYSADLKQYHDVVSAIKNADEILHLGKNEFGNCVYSTQKVVEQEHHMLNDAYELNTKQNHKIDMAAADKALEGKSLTGSQQTAFSHIISQGDLKVVTGLAGTGKSYLMGVVRQAFEDSGFRVSGVCLSGIAAEGLQEGSKIPSSTVDSRLLQWRNGTGALTSKDILIIDEAGMLGTEKMHRLLSHANGAGAKVVVVHDKEQLSAIDYGAPSRALAERFGEVALTEVVRQKDPEMRQATFEFGTAQTEKALARYESLGVINCTAADEEIARRLMIETWASDRLEGKSQLMMSVTNKSVQLLNEAARQVRISAGEIGEGENFSVSKGKRSFSVGDRIYFLKNDKSLDVKNGTLGTIDAIKNGRFSVKLDSKDSRKVSFDIGQYNKIDHGYAATIHKAQGVTVDKAYTLISKYFDRHLSYVGCTRHRESLMVFGHQKDFKDRDAMMKTLSRERSKSMSVDFAQARWIEPHNKGELNLDKYALSQKQLAHDRMEIKMLNKDLPDREFSFARAMEQVKGWMQGIIRLSDDRQMLCIGRGAQTRLVASSHDFKNHLGKEVSIRLDKEGKILNCLVKDHDKVNNLAQKGRDPFSQNLSFRPDKALKENNREIEPISIQKSWGDNFGH